MNSKSTLEEINALCEGNMMGSLGIEFLEMKSGYVYAKMPVKPSNLQPQGFLHGGANLAFAESIGGAGSAYIVGLDDYEVRGLQLAANHLGIVREGWVFAKATIIHQGRTTHVWNIDLFDEQDRLISSARLTNFIVKKSDLR